MRHLGRMFFSEFMRSRLPLGKSRSAQGKRGNGKNRPTLKTTDDRHRVMATALPEHPPLARSGQR
jgi:hypothetical protein